MKFLMIQKKDVLDAYSLQAAAFRSVGNGGEIR